MAAVTAGRFLRNRAVVMASLAKSSLFVVEIAGQLVISDVLYKGIHNFAVREFGRLILV